MKSNIAGDVDELLDRKEFNDIEKIKTIGSTFMIAAGMSLTFFVCSASDMSDFW